MILDPINSVTSIVFYRKVAKQAAGRTILYLAYLSLLFTLASLAAVKVKLMPLLNETFEWLAKSAPPLTFSGGQMSTPSAEPVTLRHPAYPEIAVSIDGARTTPVTPQDMEEGRLMAFLTKTAFYVMEKPGQLRVYDFSKAPPSPKPIIIDAEFYRSAGKLAAPVVYGITVLVCFFGFFLWKGLASLSYAMLALLFNALANANLGFGPLFNIAVYAQTLVIVMQGLTLFMPQMLGFLPWIAIMLTGAYIWLGIKTNQTEETPEPAA